MQSTTTRRRKTEVRTACHERRVRSSFVSSSSILYGGRFAQCQHTATLERPATRGAPPTHLILSFNPSFSLLIFSRSSFSLSNNLRRLSSFLLPAISSLASFSRSFLALSSKLGSDERAEERAAKESESESAPFVGDEPGVVGEEVGGAVASLPKSERWSAWKGESGSFRMASNPPVRAVCPVPPPTPPKRCPADLVGVTGPCDDPAKLSKRGFLAGHPDAGVEEDAGVGGSASSISSSISASSESKSMSSKVSSCVDGGAAEGFAGEEEGKERF